MERALTAQPTITVYMTQMTGTQSLEADETKTAAVSTTSRKGKKARNQEADAGFEAFYGETPFDTKPYQWTPHRIYDYLGEYVYGQEEAIPVYKNRKWTAVGL